jgi:uncharacterized protein|nr:hypothetical protein [uncultured bacterium]
MKIRHCQGLASIITHRTVLQRCHYRTNTHGRTDKQLPRPRLMKLHSTSPTGLLAVTAYDAAGIVVNGRRLERSFIITPHRLIEDWAPTSWQVLCASDMAILASLNCPVVLLGTGAQQHFPPPALLRPLLAQRVGVEVMDSFAACRTYNILVAEGRDVAAALILGA